MKIEAKKNKFGTWDVWEDGHIVIGSRDSGPMALVAYYNSKREDVMREALSAMAIDYSLFASAEEIEKLFYTYIHRWHD